MNQTILKLEGVNKRLSEFFALKNINLDLQKGEVHAILGENGAGKSSLMNILCGYYSMDSGSVHFNGNDVNINSPISAKKLGITMLHQDPVLFEHFTIAENIFIDNKPYLSERLKIVNFTKMFSMCQELLNNLGFSINCRTLVRYLSPAEKRITEIAKAYISNAKIIIMDEPTSAFSEYESSIFFDIIRKLTKSGISIFYISHKIEEIKHICDRVSVMRNGEIISTKYVDDVDVNNIIYTMSGLDYKNRYPKIDLIFGNELLKISHLYSSKFLKDISFSVRKKEIIGITGLIGAGGTDLAKSIFGIEKIESGKIYVDKKLVKINAPWDAIKHGIGLVPEDRTADSIFSYLQVIKNISSSSLTRVSSRMIINTKDERDLVSSYVGKLNIQMSSMYDKAAYLSGGNQQKMVLAKWIMSKSKIFIFDEPTKGIDIASKVDVYNVINELVRKGAAIILISSDFDEIIGMCDRTIVLNNGIIKGILSHKECTKEKILYLATSEN
jgi:ribose transport system ATP-binding protein